MNRTGWDNKSAFLLDRRHGQSREYNGKTPARTCADNLAVRVYHRKIIALKAFTSAQQNELGVLCGRARERKHITRRNMQLNSLRQRAARKIKDAQLYLACFVFIP